MPKRPNAPITDEQRQAIRRALEACQADREYALQRLRDFKRGERHFHGSSPLQDVTEKHRKHYESIVENMDQLIVAYEGLNA